MTLADPISSVAAPAPADDRDTDTDIDTGTDTGPSEYDRFLEALRPAVMGPRLATAFGGGPDRCHVLDAKLEPGVRAMVLYEHGPRLVRGDVIPAAGDDPEPSKVTVAPGVRLHPFPHDPDLPRLPELMEGAAPVTLVARVRGGRPDAPCVVRRLLLRYRPGKRATVLLRFPGGGLVVKAYHDPAKAAAVAAEAQALGRAARDSDGRLRFAPTVGHDPDLAVVVQQVVHGRPLDAMLGTGVAGPGSDAERAVRLAARALAALHAAGTVTSRRRDGDRELRRFSQRALGIASVDPLTGEAAGLLAERLARTQSGLPAARLGPVHGDCKPSQFLLDGAGVVVMDLDHVGEADQAGDVGTFLASLRQLALRRSPGVGVRGSVPSALGHAFVDAYLSCADDDVLARIRWQEAVALERKALRAFARAPRSPLALGLIREAERCLDVLEAS
jgi:hypothetical protein